MESTDILRQEVERLSRDLEQTARLTQALEAENRDLQERWDEQEILLDTKNHEIYTLREALAKVQTSQKVSMCTGVEQEESLLEEKESKEASLTSSLQGLERELRQTRQELLRLQDERDRLAAEVEDLSRQQCAAELERKNLRSELREAKQREQRLLTDINDLEEQNVSLQKDVASLQSSQVEFEAAKHEVQHLQEEVTSMKTQLHDAESLRDIMEKKLEEALEAFQSEREQKYALRRELDQRLTAESPVLHLGGLSFASFNLDPHRQGPQQPRRHKSLPTESAAKIPYEPSSYRRGTCPLPSRMPLLKAVHCEPLHLQGSSGFEKNFEASTCDEDRKTEALLELLSEDVRLSNANNGEATYTVNGPKEDLRRAWFTGNGENGICNGDAMPPFLAGGAVLFESGKNRGGWCSGKSQRTVGNSGRPSTFTEDTDWKKATPCALRNGLPLIDATVERNAFTGRPGQKYPYYEAGSTKQGPAQIVDSRYYRDLGDISRTSILSDGLLSTIAAPRRVNRGEDCLDRVFRGSDVESEQARLADQSFEGGAFDGNGLNQLSDSRRGDITEPSSSIAKPSLGVAKPNQDPSGSAKHCGREDVRSDGSTENSDGYLDSGLSACRFDDSEVWDDEGSDIARPNLNIGRPDFGVAKPNEGPSDFIEEDVSEDDCGDDLMRVRTNYLDADLSACRSEEDCRSESSILAERLMAVAGPPTLASADIEVPTPTKEGPRKQKKRSWRRKSIRLLSRVSCAVVSVIFAP